MAERLYRLKRLARKNYNVQVKGLDSERWRLALQADPQFPRNLGQLRQLWRDLTEHRRRRAPAFDVQVTRGVLRRRIEECGEAAVARFFTALGSPLLGNRDLDEIDAMMDADLPAF